MRVDSPGAAEDAAPSVAETDGLGGTPQPNPASTAAHSATVTGWLLDLYADPQDELALWLLEDEDCCEGGSTCANHLLHACAQARPYYPRRLRLRQAFPIAFYAAGPGARLRLLWQYLARSNRQLIEEGTLALSRQERRDLFLPEPVTVLAVEVQKPGLLPALFRRAAAAFPDLTYYDADLPLTARHAARYGTFPLARLQVSLATSSGTDNRSAGINHRSSGPATVQALQALDSPWDLDAPLPPLRVMHLSPDCDPRRGTPAWLEVQVETLLSAAEGALSEIEGRQTGAGKPAGFDCTQPACGAPGAIERRRRWTCRLSLRPERALLIGLGALLRCYDPDLLLTGWGDTWLLPHLLALSEKLGIPLPLNRGAEGSGSSEDPGRLSAFEACQAEPPPAASAKDPGRLSAIETCQAEPPPAASAKDPGRLSAIEACRPDPDDDLGRPLPCDARQPILRRPERSYQAYGQVIYRGQQVLLSGRWHIDKFNAMMFHDYALEGILESARVSSLPVQQAARLSPGTGISTMQIVTALRQGVMTPWHKQQAEMPKSALDLLHADQGGLVYQPIIGLHHDVAEIDFISMYPSIMARFNISPETVGAVITAQTLPEKAAGLVPETLQPLLEKRVALKQRIASLPRWDPRKKQYQARAAAHKWLLVTCFGYLGYKNARFGRIEAHQAVTAYSRECLLRAKEAAEDLGYTVLHMYVDGLWVQRSLLQARSLREDTSGLSVEAVQPLLDEIALRTGLPIALDGIYRWVAFLPSRSNQNVPVANRYFGVFQDGSLKVRGLEARRGDTPPFIAAVQMGILERLAQAGINDSGYSISSDDLRQALPEILPFLRQELRRLRSRGVPLEQLLVAQKLSRTLEQYRSPSPAARAAAQLAAAGRSTRPGQVVRFLYLRGKPDVYAWDCPSAPQRFEPEAQLPARLDIERYTTLFLRACAAVLQPFGVTEKELRLWLIQ